MAIAMSWETRIKEMSGCLDWAEMCAPSMRTVMAGSVGVAQEQ